MTGATRRDLLESGLTAIIGSAAANASSHRVARHYVAETADDLAIPDEQPALGYTEEGVWKYVDDEWRRFDWADVVGVETSTGQTSLDVDVARTAHHVSGAEIDLREYGADPTGTDSIHPQLDDALDDANPGDTIVLRDGEYLLEERRNILKNVDIRGEEATLIDGRGATGGYDPLLLISGSSAASGDVTSVESEPTRYDESIAVADASVVNTGDVLQIEQGSGESTRVEYTYVTGVDRTGNEDTVELASGLRHKFTENATVSSPQMLNSPTVAGLRLHQPEKSGNFLEFRRCINPTFRRCTVDGYHRRPFKADRSLNPVWFNCHAVNPHEFGGGNAEPFYTSQTTDPKFLSLSAHGVRRAIDLANGVVDAQIVDGTFTGIHHRAVAHHGGAVTGYIVLGGTYVMRKDSAAAFTTSAYSMHDCITHVNAVVGRGFVETHGDMKVSSSTVTVHPEAEGQTNVVGIYGSDFSIKDVNVLVPTGNNHMRVFDLNNEAHPVKNVEIDVDVRVDRTGSPRTHPNAIRISADHATNEIQDIAVDLDLVGWEFDSSAVRIDNDNRTVEGLTISGNMRGLGGTAVQVRGDAGVSDLLLDDLTVSSLQECISLPSWTVEGIAENIRIQNGEFESENAEEIEMNNENIDGLRIVNSSFEDARIHPRAADVRIRDCLGFTTEESGTATVTAGSTSVRVPHELDWEPSIADIQLTPAGDLSGATYWYVSNVSSSSFDIVLDAEPTRDVPFSWSVDVTS